VTSGTLEAFLQVSVGGRDQLGQVGLLGWLALKSGLLLGQGCGLLGLFLGLGLGLFLFFPSLFLLEKNCILFCKLFIKTLLRS
jgi:hypothetical protein